MTGSATSVAAALADRYRIERELGAGGMATVYLAEDQHQRRVAVKVLRPELAAALRPAIPAWSGSGAILIAVATASRKRRRGWAP